MKAILAQIRMNLRLTTREPSMLFFSYVFPLIFFFVFAIAFRAEQGGAITQVVASVLVIGVLGNGLFGGGIRMVMDREANILRRFKVAPITALPILVSSLVVSLVTYLPSLLIMLAIAIVQYRMPVPQEWPSLAVFVILAIIAFRALGVIVASVANSMQESQIILQMLYFPMMFLSGATFPLTFFPDWLQIVSQFIPSTHLFTGVQGILLRKESLVQNWIPLIAMILTSIVGTFIALKLFRWEKEEKLRASAKFWVLAVLMPFFLIGGYQAYSKDNLVRNKQIERVLRRSRTVLLRDARVFIGDGRVLEQASVLIKDGKIDRIIEGPAPDAKSLAADPFECTGKTVLPGFIDAHIHAGAPGGYYEDPREYQKPGRDKRALAQYLYSGVIAVRSTGDWVDSALKLKAISKDGAFLGADYYSTGPLFTAEGGHPTQMLQYLPGNMKDYGKGQFVRLPKSADEGRAMVRDLHKAGFDGIKIVLEEGSPGMPMPRFDLAIATAVAAEARSLKLPVAVHTHSVRDIRDALAIGATSIEHGAMVEPIPADLLTALAKAGVYYDATLAVADGYEQWIAGKTGLLELGLVRQTQEKALLDQTRKVMFAPMGIGMRNGMRNYRMSIETASENLKRAADAGVKIVTGTDAGNPLTFHGPGVHRELRLWVAAGVSPRVALQGATGNAAQLLGIANRVGFLKPGLEASLFVVDGNPLEDITSTERIWQVWFKGERIVRPELFDQE